MPPPGGIYALQRLALAVDAARPWFDLHFPEFSVELESGSDSPAHSRGGYPHVETTDFSDRP